MLKYAYMMLDPARKQALLKTPISKLGLKITSGRLKALIDQLYRELEAAGVAIRPECYLSDEWGCPHGIPIIGVPFYLGSEETARLEGEMTGIEAETDEETLKYLRHEAGHAFNYAYRLYELPDWRTVFGAFAKPYREDYRPKLFDPRFVRHLPGWYAQKHPDEDFAETFAVLVTPNSRWKEDYANTPVMAKLEYVRKLINEYEMATPIKFEKVYDFPVEEITETLAEWYQDIAGKKYKIRLHQLIEEDLKQIFTTATTPLSAADYITKARSSLIHNIHNWTGKNNIFVEEAVDEIIKKVQIMNLHVQTGSENNTLVNLTVLLTTLIINHLQSEESFVL